MQISSSFDLIRRTKVTVLALIALTLIVSALNSGAAVLGNLNDESSDNQLPSITIISPFRGSMVTGAGFKLTGRADHQKVSSIRVRVSDPLRGEVTSVANVSSGLWGFSVTPPMISPGSNVAIQVTALDRLKKVAAVINTNVRVINDAAPPRLTVNSHRNNHTVEHTGVLLSGVVRDNTMLKELVASVHDPILGPVVNQKSVEVAGGSGNWALAVRRLSPSRAVRVNLTASDMSGNSTVQELTLNVIQAAASSVQLINRITFGATPDLLEEARTLGLAGFIDQQLNPSSIDDSEFDAMLLNLKEPETRREFETYEFLHAVYSRRQLLEVMTWFWENHFSTDIATSWTARFDLNENREFRRHALGRFRDLLQISATSPAMVLYLNNHTNFKKAPNENYSRELMELHTMGVRGGFTSRDVREVARVFTGWRIENNAFGFSQSVHDDDAKVVLGQTIPARSGMAGGEQVLDILAAHPSTARFICTKLLRLFVSDQPAETSVGDCASDFLKSDGDIGLVVGSILNSQAFRHAERFHSKVKTAFEFIVGLIRNVQPEVSAGQVRWVLRDMGMRLFYHPIPTGWSEVGEDWVNSNQLVQRLLFANSVAFGTFTPNRTHIIDPAKLFLERGFETAEGVAGFLFDLLLANDYTTLEWDQAMGILSPNGTAQFDIHANDADDRLRSLLSTLVSYPTYQLQ